MNQFSLSRSCALPDSVMENGSFFSVNTDFRIILRILRLMNDPEVLDGDKHHLFLRLFFKKEIPDDPYVAFEWFVSCGNTERNGSGEQDFDFEQDASEIYCSFMQLYHIDLLDCKHMHWWKFNSLLSGAFACDTALSNKIRIRHADDPKSKRNSDMSKAKQRVKIRKNISRSDSALEEEMRKRLMRGEPVSDLIGR